MSTESNRAIARRDFDEVWSKGNLAAADDLIAANVVRHDLGASTTVQGIEGYRQAVAAYRAAFPDIHFTVEDIAAEAEKVVVRWTAEGTHKGEFNGIPATGKKARVMGISFNRMAEGKIAEMWVSWDALSLLKQLGVGQ